MRSLLVIGFILGSTLVFGQRLDAKASKSSLKIGEPFTLTYTVETGPNDSIDFQPETDKIPMRASGGGQLSDEGFSVEISEPFKAKTSRKSGGTTWTGTYNVVVWDSGTFIIPGPNISIADSTFQFRNISIYCDFTDKKSGVDLYDIRENYAELPPEENPFVRFAKDYWWLLLLVLIPIALIIFLKKRRQKNIPVRIEKAMSLKERTLMAIDALENEKLWEQDRLKEHFVELSYILRSYLTARYDISLLEKTTYETKLLLTQKGLNDDTIETIGRILSESDMVKFAKSRPEVIEILKVSTLARQIVAETSPLEFDNYE